MREWSAGFNQGCSLVFCLAVVGIVLLALRIDASGQPPARARIGEATVTVRDTDTLRLERANGSAIALVMLCGEKIKLMDASGQPRFLVDVAGKTGPSVELLDSAGRRVAELRGEP